MAQRETKGDLRIDRTQNLLRRAMLELLRQMSFEEITVKLLAQQATINRKTFYAHYSGKEQLLEEMFREADEALCGCLVYQKPMPDAQPDREQMEADLRRYLSTVDQYREYLETLYTDSTTAIGMRVLDEVIQQGHSCLFLTPDSRGRLPVRLWHAKIVTFFISTWDWWLDQQDYTVEEGAALLCRSMLVSEAGVFRYVRAREKRPPEEQAEDK